MDNKTKEVVPLGTYIARRTLGMVPMLLAITIISFLMVHAAPGNAFNAILNPNIKNSQALIVSLEKANGLNEPLWWQYMHWLGNFVVGKWGFSFAEHQPVLSLIGPAIRNTLILAVMAELLTLLFGIPIGVLQARKPYRTFDYTSSTIGFVMYSFPYFVLALLLIYVFAINLRIFPAQGAEGSGQNAGSLLDHVYHAFLPAVSLAIVSIANYSRNTRGSMLEVARRDFVRTARAKGIREKNVFTKHVLRNGLIPIITQLGFDIGNLVSGAVILEGLFSYQGMGLLTISAVENRDYTVLMAVTVLFAVAILMGNLIADILYAVTDPRIRYN